MNFKIFLLFGLVLFVCTENVQSLPVPDEKEEAKPAVELEAPAEEKKDEDDDAEEDLSLTDLEEIKGFFEELQKGFDEIFKALKEAKEEAVKEADEHKEEAPKAEKK